jgi:nicotinate-nucleotide pyrophosphorylase (carboxylating)
MTGFSPAETAACSRLVDLALAEDLGAHFPLKDVTSSALLHPYGRRQAVFAARQAGVLAGLPAVALVLAALDPDLALESNLEDGAVLEAGTRIAVVRGYVQSVLMAERTALNFLQHLSGVATLTRRYVEAVAGLPARILDTRKTTPGWRLLEKYAVRCGGGHNHRMGLYDGVLIKDNHLAMKGPFYAIQDAVGAARDCPLCAGMPIEVEVDSLEQLDEALAPRLSPPPEIVLLDNMTTDRLREAVRRRNAVAPGVQLEASGGVNLDTVRAIAETGVDRISVGALTHSAPALDIALDYEAS